jgi:tetratricopeptide (TPR) repeat protein
MSDILTQTLEADTLEAFHQQKYSEAEYTLRRLIPILEDSPNLTITLNNLGLALYFQGKLLEAEKVFKEALILKESQFGTNHPSLGITLQNLGKVYADLAEESYTRALSILTTSLGEEDDRVELCLNNLKDLHDSRTPSH